MKIPLCPNCRRYHGDEGTVTVTEWGNRFPDGEVMVALFSEPEETARHRQQSWAERGIAPEVVRRDVTTTVTTWTTDEQAADTKERALLVHLAETSDDD